MIELKDGEFDSRDAGQKGIQMKFTNSGRNRNRIEYSTKRKKL
jgi:hypothetical protein